MTYRLSKRAVEDLDAILGYTLERWGPEQVRAYSAEFASLFEFLSRFPKAGRLSGRRDREFVHAPYIVFYREQDDGILVGRIIHGARRK